MQVDDLEPVWRGLANPLRRRMLDELRTGPLSTGVLAERFPEMSRFAVMQHLGVLKEGGLVVRHKEGRRTLNYLNPVPIQQIYHRWVEQYQQPWTEALVALKGQLEQELASESGQTTASAAADHQRPGRVASMGRPSR